MRNLFFFKTAKGFTLVELIMVVVVAGIISVAVVPRFVNQNSFNARFYRDDLMGAIRFARNHAITTGCSVQFQLNQNNNNRFNIFRDANCVAGSAASYTTAVARPGGGTNTVVNGIALNGATTITFNADGSATCAGNMNINLGANTSAITLECTTGYVH